MRSRNDQDVCATVFAALLMIGCSVSSMAASRKRRLVVQKQLEEAVRTWEDEGGAIVSERDVEEEPVLRSA